MVYQKKKRQQSYYKNMGKEDDKDGLFYKNNFIDKQVGLDKDL